MEEAHNLSCTELFPDGYCLVDFHDFHLMNSLEAFKHIHSS